MEKKSNRGGARPGAGRKKGSKNTGSTPQCATFQFRLSIQELESLKSRAAAKNMNVSAFVKSILFPDD